jgi:RNase P protein component
MSRYSIKQLCQRDLFNLFLINITLANSSDEIDETLKYVILSEELKEQKYLFSRVFILKFNWDIRVLSTLSDHRYRDYLRMNRAFVQHITDLIRFDTIFQNNFNLSQTSVENQLQCVLYKLENDDSESEFLFTITFWRISKKYVLNCIKRVVKILCRLRNNFIKWSTARARIRESLANDTRESEFIEVVEKIDETNVMLNFKSEDRYDEELFFNRKKRYALNLSAVCDSNKRFIYFLCDWLNSQHDQRIFAARNLHKQPHLYFSKEQHLLDDSVYIDSRYLVTSYKASH